MTPQPGDILLVRDGEGWRSALISNSSGDICLPSGERSNLCWFQGRKAIVASPADVARAIQLLRKETP